MEHLDDQLKKIGLQLQFSYTSSSKSADEIGGVVGEQIRVTNPGYSTAFQAYKWIVTI